MPATDQQVPSRCIVHVHSAEKGKLFPWRKDKWDVVQRACVARKTSKKYHSSKYRPFVEALPDNPGECDGYHSKCYSSFTAIPQSAKSMLSPVGPEKTLLRSDVPQASTSSSSDCDKSSSGIFPKICFFCEKVVKRRPDGTREYLGSLQTKTARERIIEVAHVLKLPHLIVKLSGVNPIPKELKFHHSCRALYYTRAERAKGFGLSTIKEEPVEPKYPLQCTFTYVKENVIDKNRPERLSSIYEHYIDLCTEHEVAPGVSKVQYLGNLLEKEFPSLLSFHSPECRQQGVIVHSTAIEYSSIKAVYDIKKSPEGQVIRAALLLRQALMSVAKESLPDPLTLTSLTEGEGAPPEIVRTFFQHLLGGPNTSHYSETVKRRSDSLSQDALFSVQHGNLKPKKHILMGMSMKSMTGSKKIITMLNRMGHSINYHAVEEIETDLAYAILDRKEACPAGSVPGVPCGLAFDNYDELTNTLSGADTLHDTMGIMYQSKTPGAEGPDSNQVRNQVLVEPPLPPIARKPTRKRRRKLDVPDTALPPYRKKPRMDDFSYAMKEYRLGSIDASVLSRKLDFLWMIAHALEVDQIPMWTGFNSQIYVDPIPKQAVLYMPNIDRSPTNDDVVVETLVITQKCAQECGQPYGVVTYDLDVAKRAIKIQVTESPRFDNVFIMFGAFHLQMCLFKAIGKLIKESGMAEMLVEANVLASGSLNGFINCKNFNRCKRLHPMLSLALETLHFRQFCSTYEEIDMVIALAKESPLDDKESRDQLCSAQPFVKIFEEYTRYSQATLNGELGPTAQFYMQHIQRVNLYLIIDRAIRESDVDLYTWALTQATDIFFGTNRQNYARWMSKYQLDLLNITITHPGLKELLIAGLFSIRRTDNQFSRVPVDLTLEQTINADAASRMTGYTDATNNYSARLRWSATKGARAALIGAMLDMAGLNATGDDQSHVSHSRIARDNKDLQNLLKTVDGFANPFTVASETLVNIQTGKAATNEITESLLNVEKIGKEKHDAFVTECINDPTRFERSIAQNRLRTFADQGARSRKAANPIIQELRCTRDLFGRLAILAGKRKVDFEYLVTFPLTPVPLTMCRTDGTVVTMSHGKKSDLFSLLEGRVADHGAPTEVSASLIDGNFLLHCLPPNLPPTYGGLSRYLLNVVLSFPSKRVDILFDTYEEPSIKGDEHQHRGAEATVYRITGPDQIRPRDIEKALKSPSFKQQLPRFLVKDWGEQWYSGSLEGREVYLGVDTSCFLFTAVNGKVEMTPLQRLECNHPEADTRICLHFFDAISNERTRGDIVVRATDTDIAVILLHHCQNASRKVWMDVGTSGKGNRRYINISAIATEIGPQLCSALPGFHAFTGCDYTAFFIRKGKKRPLKIAEGNDSFLNAFTSLALDEVNTTTCQTIHQYTAELYGAKKPVLLNKHRYNVFQKKFGPKKGKKLLASLKGVDASSIPPCENVINQKIHRCNFIAMIWHAACNNIVPKEPKLGWEIENNSYQHVWFTGPQMPDSVAPDGSEDNEDDDDEDFSTHLDSDTDDDDDDSEIGRESDDDDDDNYDDE